jgi:RimJ/RimL family protein N-acetyltransferase
MLCSNQPSALHVRQNNATITTRTFLASPLSIQSGGPEMRSAIRLDALHFHDLVTHFLALPQPDRRLRFGRVMDDAAVIDYVGRIDFARDAVFAMIDPVLDIAGAVHVAFVDGAAEAGLSVLPAARGRGFGTALLQRAYTHAHERGVAALRLQCLADNEPMRRLARRAGMQLSSAQGETSAWLRFPSTSDRQGYGERAARLQVSVAGVAR